MSVSSVTEELVVPHDGASATSDEPPPAPRVAATTTAARGTTRARPAPDVVAQELLDIVAAHAVDEAGACVAGAAAVADRLAAVYSGAGAGGAKARAPGKAAMKEANAAMMAFLCADTFPEGVSLVLLVLDVALALARRQSPLRHHLLRTLRYARGRAEEAAATPAAGKELKEEAQRDTGIDKAGPAQGSSRAPRGRGGERRRAPPPDCDAAHVASRLNRLDAQAVSLVLPALGLDDDAERATVLPMARAAVAEARLGDAVSLIIAAQLFADFNCLVLAERLLAAPEDKSATHPKQADVDSAIALVKTHPDAALRPWAVYRVFGAGDAKRAVRLIKEWKLPPEDFPEVVRSRDVATLRWHIAKLEQVSADSAARATLVADVD